jgi:hypothetical protein
MSRKKTGQRYSIKIPNRPFEGDANFKYLGTTLTEQNCMQEEIKSRIIRRMLATIQSRVYSLPACCPGM